MARKILNIKNWSGGTSPSEKIGQVGSFYFGKSLNIFDEPTKLTILPKTVKVSSAVVIDLIKWIVSSVPGNTNKYFYGDTGHIYKEYSNGTWEDLVTIANSYGQGLEVHDDYLYYTQNTQIGRYGPLSGIPIFDDDWQTGLDDTSSTKFAPIKIFKEGFAVGHGNKVAWWDGTIWDVDRLIFPPGLNVRSIEVIDEYMVFGTWRGTAITDNEEGYLFFWDGTLDTFNFFVSIPEGGCNALVNSKNRLQSIVGSSGDILLNYRPFQTIQKIPKLTLKEYVEIFPGAVTNWQNKVQIGVAGNTNSTDLSKGVYTWGSKDDSLPEVLNFSFPISTGNTGSTIKVGACKGFGNYLYISWQDGSTYGVDKVTYNGNPYVTANFESLIFDAGQIYTDSQAQRIKVYHLPLVTGESIQIGYKINRASSYTLGTANSTVGSTETNLDLPSADARFHEIQIEVILATSGTTSPTVLYAGMIFEDLENEESY